MRLLSLTLLAALSLALPARAHEVKDPVCRMTVDSDTTRHRHRLGSRTFCFCSRQCRERFAADPQKYEKLAAELEKQQPREYAAELRTPAAAAAGRPVAMEFSIRYRDTGALVTGFELVHERLLHLIMVTEDLSWFEHQHPVRGADGIFRLTWTFPRPGPYRLYLDFTPADGDNQVLPLPLAVGGGEGKSLPLRPDGRLAREAGGCRVALRVAPEELRVERPAVFTYELRDRRGAPVRDLQPFIGAVGHLLAISRDGEQVLHTHALQGASQGSMEDEPVRVTPEMVSQRGPVISFKLTFPAAGLYRLWAQFMRRNRVITVPFTFRVADIWETAAPAPAAGVQRATVVIDGAYRPATLAVRAGRPVEITFLRREKAGCGDELSIPALGIRRTLKTGEKSVVRFTPRKAGTIRFTCGMRMYRGQVVAR